MNPVVRLLILYFVAGLIALSGTPASGQSGLTTIRVASNANDDVTPLLWAQHTNMFEKAGLHVEFVKMNSGAAVTAAVLGGSIDVGKSSLLPLISAHYRKLPVSAVAPGEVWISSAPISALVASKTTRIASAKDLSGKVVAVQALRDFSEYALRDWVDTHGGDSSSLKIVEVPQSAILSALEEGRAVAANMSNPGLAAVLASNSVNVVSRPNDTVGKHFLLTAWFASNDYIAAHADAVKKFAAVMAKAAKYTNTHHADTVSLTAPFWAIDPEVLARMPRAEIGDQLDTKDIQPVIDVAAKYGVIDKAFDAHELISEGVK